MAGEFKIKTGLLLGPTPTQSVTSIQDTSTSITSDASSLLATGKAVYDFFTSEISPLSSDISNLESSVGDLDTLTQSHTTDISILESSQIIQDVSIDATWQRWLDSNRTGFLNQTDTNLSFNDSTYVFTLEDAGSGWAYYRDGVKYEISGDVSTRLIPSGTPPADTYYITIDSTNGALSVSTTPWSLEETELLVAFITFDSANTPNYVLGEERHSMLIDRRMHKYLHETRGTQFVSGGALTGPDVSAGDPTVTDANNTVGIELTEIADEDLFQELPALTRPGGSGSEYLVFIRNSGNLSDWRLESTPLPAGTTYIQYDDGTNMTEATPGQYVNTYIMFTNLSSSSGNPQFAILPGQAQFDTLDLAILENPARFNFAGMPIAEYVIAWQLTWEVSTGYTATDGQVALASEPRRIQVSTTSASQVTSELHNDLAGIQGGDIGERYHLNLTQYNDYVGKSYVDGSLALIDTDISNLESSVGTLDGLIQTNITDISNLETSIGNLAFTSLSDTPNTYLDGSAGAAVVVNDSGDGLEFASRIWREDSNEVTLVNENADVLFYENIEIEPDSGVGTFVDKDVTSSSADGTEESYTFNMDGTTIAKIYAQSDGVGGIKNEKFVSSVTFQAESSVYFTGIPEVSTGQILYYNPTTFEVTYGDASTAGGGGGTPLNLNTKGIVYWNGSELDTSTSYTVGSAGSVLEFGMGDVSIQDRTSVDVMRLYYKNNILLSTNNQVNGFSYLYSPQGNSNVALGGTLNTIFIDASSVGIGTLCDTATYFTVRDTNATKDTVLARFITEYSDAFDIYNTGQIFCPSIGAGSTSNVIFFNDTTGEITYGSSPSGSLAGLSDVSIGGTIPDGSSLVYNSTGSYWTYGPGGSGAGDYWELDGSTLRPKDETVNVELSAIQVNTDAGATTLVDMDVSSASSGSEQSYAFNIDGSAVVKVYGEAAASGDVLTELGFVVKYAQYMGDPKTNGSWRFYPDSNGDLVFEKRISGTWTQKGKFTE